MRKLYSMLAVVLMIFSIVGFLAQASGDGARIWTDKEDYGPSETVNIFGCGFNALVNVTVANQGGYTETFNVTLYANTTIIETKQITLTSLNFTKITYTWNTTDFAKGNYTIWAYAWPVPGETDTADNTFIDGWVYVSLIGDINTDGYVGIDDIFTIASHFGAEQGTPQYDPNLDINDDGYIGVDDIFTAAQHFGQEDP